MYYLEPARTRVALAKLQGLDAETTALALKAVLPEYSVIEHQWEAHVHCSLGLPWPLSEAQREAVRKVDQRALIVEMALREHPGLAVEAPRMGGFPSDGEVGAGVSWLGRACPRECWVAVEQALFEVDGFRNAVGRLE